MTINYINIGSSANKGDGDTLRTAFRKINENFAFLSTSSGFISTGSSTSLSISPSAPSTATDGTLWFNSTEARTFVRYNGVWVDASPQITPPPTTSTETIITMGSVPPDTGEGTLWFNVNDARTYINYSGAWIDSSPQVTPPSILPADNIGVLANDGNGNLYWTTASITASTGTSVDLTTVTSHILPSADLTYDLGSLSKQWRSLYVGTSTIYIGGVAVSVNTASNTLVVGTSTQAVTVATEDYVATQIAAIPVTENYIGTGNFTVTASDTVNYVVAGTGVSTSTVIFNFRIHGSVGGVAPGVSDPEYVTITTGSQPISAIYLTKYVSADNRAFFAIQEGNQWTIPQNQVTPEMIAYGHFGVNGVQVGQNILSGFGPLEPNTTYTFWIQQIGAAVTEYVFATDRFDTGGISTTFYSQNPLAPTTITPTTSVVGGELDPTLSLIRGYKYTFNVNAPGQPLWIMTTSTYNITNGYSHGVTNNGTSTGIITFTVPGNAPDTLYYISESSSLLMKGVINISGVTSNSSNGNIVQSATAPTGTTSTIWYDTVGGRSYVYYDNSWVDTSPPSTYTFTGTSTLVNGTSTVSLSSTGTLTVPGNLTFPDLTVQTTAYPGLLVPADGDSVSGVANLVFYTGDWYNTSKVGINPATGVLTLSGTGGAGGIILPNLATISAVDIGFSFVSPSNGPGGVAVQENSLTVGIANPTWASTILANPGAHQINFNGGLSNVAIGGISGPAPGTNVYTLTGTWPANATGFPITITSNDYIDGITEIVSDNGVIIETSAGTWTFGQNGRTTFPFNMLATDSDFILQTDGPTEIRNLSSATGIDIVTDITNGDTRWSFGVDGNLTFPSDSLAFTLGTDFTGTIIGGTSPTEGYIRVESTDGPPNFNPVPISTEFYNFLSTLTAGTEFTVNTVVDGTTYNTVVAFTQFAGGNPASTGRNDLYWTKVSGDELPFSYSASALTLTFISNSIVIAPTGITFPDATVQTTAFTGLPQAITTTSNVTFGSITFPDSSVITSYKPVTVIAQTTSTQTITDSASAAFIQFFETVDTASAYESGVFTVPYTGYYQVNMSVYFSTEVTLNSGSFFLIDTNLDYTKQVRIIDGSWAGSYIHYSTVIPATAGDAIRFAIRQVSGADIDISSGSRLTIHRVSIS